MRIAFLGGGVMGEAMIGAVLRKGLAVPREITVGDVNPQRCSLLQERYQITALEDNRQATANADVVALCVKPQILPTVLAQLRGELNPNQLVLSIVAGARIATFTQALQHGSVVRAMPNAPAQIGEGITIWTAVAINPSQEDTARRILASLGREIYVSDEKLLDMATAVSGSGPAYMFLVAEALIEAAVYIGLPHDVARELVLQTMLGSARHAQETGKHPAELRNMVTSPGGTTAEALLQLEEDGFRASLIRAVVAAYEKAKLLGGEGERR